ncbi:MAG: phosphate/phosphite/phosphonate ABC transporter substrate-binding protein [Gammaproteobacteria bacterium]|jgi:ABC-type phosphate/phosphonate transport system substrate-binding protein|nr:phosphate/phosphite/phosphonate ABC transporter substrate-binding protein [Gammaproteobacteria bacterium]
MSRFLGVLLLFLLAAPVGAQELIFTSPPRESAEAGEKMYGPIASYLSAQLGRKVVYEHSRNWLHYIDQLRADHYDLVFDGPHFISWRMQRHGHTPLVRLTGGLSFVVLARADDQRVTEMSQLAGRPVCGHAPPNLATLTMQAQFPNVSREPIVREMRGFNNIFKAVLDGKCIAGVVPLGVYRKLNTGEAEGRLRVLFQSPPVAHQGITASSRVSVDEQERIRTSLLAEESQEATKALRDRFGRGKPFQSASVEEYAGLSVLLKDVWGFN